MTLSPWQSSNWNCSVRLSRDQSEMIDPNGQCIKNEGMVSNVLLTPLSYYHTWLRPNRQEKLLGVHMGCCMQRSLQLMWNPYLLGSFPFALLYINFSLSGKKKVCHFFQLLYSFQLLSLYFYCCCYRISIYLADTNLQSTLFTIIIQQKSTTLCPYFKPFQCHSKAHTCCSVFKALINYFSVH